VGKAGNVLRRSAWLERLFRPHSIANPRRWLGDGDPVTLKLSEGQADGKRKMRQ
jgi:hypothetical protein